MTVYISLTATGRSCGVGLPRWQPFYTHNKYCNKDQADTLIKIPIHCPLKWTQRHHLFSKCSLITQFIFRFVLATDRLAATHKILPAGIWVKKIGNCRSKSLFSQVSIIVTFSLWEIFITSHSKHSSSRAELPAFLLAGSDCLSTSPLFYTIYTSAVKSCVDAKVLQLNFKALNSCAQTYLKDPPWYPYVLNCQGGQKRQLAQPAWDTTVSLWN